MYLKVDYGARWICLRLYPSDFILSNIPDLNLQDSLKHMHKHILINHGRVLLGKPVLYAVMGGTKGSSSAVLSDISLPCNFVSREIHLTCFLEASGW